MTTGPASPHAPRVVKLLDDLAEDRRVHVDMLPFPSTPA